MKLVYEAPNIVEAQIVKDLLIQAGLNARVDGEYLQGGIGELPAVSMVRVLVADSDFTEAQDVIRDWDQNRTSDSIGE